MITINEIITMFWTYTDPFFVWFNALPEVWKWTIWITAGIIATYLACKLLKKLSIWLWNWSAKKDSEKLPEQNIETQRNYERESDIECCNNTNSKIINNVYKF